MKIWLEDDAGNPILGDGRLTLLKAVEESGSLSAAAEKLGISYRHAWGQIKKIEQRLGVPIMERKIGGKTGGGSILTPEIKIFIRKFEKMRRDVCKYTESKLRNLKI
jgi:molybdate transport system regulatory protein